ncbi:MAG TPA: TGS domain-containing protein, partial [bacterium]|nr:TGS domain-containing protein [bacterium]
PKPLIIAGNKSDLADNKIQEEFIGKYEAGYEVVLSSALKKEGIGKLRKAVFESSRIIRVYSKEPGKKPDMDSPFTLPFGSNVLDLAEIIHKDFFKNLKYACIWGSGKFDGQRVQKDYILHDRDIVEYHIK